MMSVNELVKVNHAIAIDRGWHDEEREIGTILCLIHSEVSEAMEAARAGDQEKFREELADIAIRLFDLAGDKQIDLEAEILKKMAKNAKRPYRHGGKKF